MHSLFGFFVSGSVTVCMHQRKRLAGGDIHKYTRHRSTPVRLTFLAPPIATLALCDWECFAVSGLPAVPNPPIPAMERPPVVVDVQPRLAVRGSKLTCSWDVPWYPISDIVGFRDMDVCVPTESNLLHAACFPLVLTLLLFSLFLGVRPAIFNRQYYKGTFTQKAMINGQPKGSIEITAPTEPRCTNYLFEWHAPGPSNNMRSGRPLPPGHLFSIPVRIVSAEEMKTIEHQEAVSKTLGVSKEVVGVVPVPRAAAAPIPAATPSAMAPAAPAVVGAGAAAPYAGGVIMNAPGAAAGAAAASYANAPQLGQAAASPYANAAMLSPPGGAPAADPSSILNQPATPAAVGSGYAAGAVAAPAPALPFVSSGYALSMSGYSAMVSAGYGSPSGGGYTAAGYAPPGGAYTVAGFGAAPAAGSNSGDALMNAYVSTGYGAAAPSSLLPTSNDAPPPYKDQN
jgi:hypothetical protein